MTMLNAQGEMLNAQGNAEGEMLNAQGETVHQPALSDQTSAGRAPSAELKAIVEALIFASPEPLTPRMLFKLLADEPKEDVSATIQALKVDYDTRPGLQFVEVAGGYQIVTRPELHEWVRRLFHERSTQKLTVQVAQKNDQATKDYESIALKKAQADLTKAQATLKKFEGQETSLVGLEKPLIDLKNPGLYSIPLGFLCVILGSLLWRDRKATEMWEELYVRQNTGIHADAAAAH